MAATFLFLAMAPTTAAFTTRYPTQSLGNRGSDVRAAQGFLLARGYSTPSDGIFGTATRSAVIDFQMAYGLPANGIVADATWAKLVMTVRPGGLGPAVRILQTELNEKRRARLTVDGIYSTATRNAVLAFQRHMSHRRQRRASAAKPGAHCCGTTSYPSFNASSLCDYSVGQRARRTGRPATAIGQLEAAARAFAATGHGRVSVGDASFEHGGNIPLHKTHEVGLDVDVRPIRKAGEPVHLGHELAARRRTTGPRPGR